MILSNTVASSVVLNGATSTVNTPADESAPAGFSPMSNGKSWIASPGPAYSFAALGTLTTTGNIDWSIASYFTLTTTSAQNLTLTFGLTGATGTASYQLGQMIKIRVTGAGTPTITWPATISWAGVTATPTAVAVAPLVVDGKPLVIELVCTGTGSAPTFDGTFLSV
jgi:hypothetical protein